MRKSYAVFGLGEFGKSVALELSKMGADVLVCDMDESKLAAPMLRGTKVYSYTISPVMPLAVSWVLSVVLGVNVSKPSGTGNVGAISMRRLPLPLTVRR